MYTTREMIIYTECHLTNCVKSIDKCTVVRSVRGGVDFRRKGRDIINGSRWYYFVVFNPTELVVF